MASHVVAQSSPLKFVYPEPGKFNYELADGDKAIIEWTPKTVLATILLNCSSSAMLNGATESEVEFINANSGVLYHVRQTGDAGLEKQAIDIVPFVLDQIPKLVVASSAYFHVKKEQNQRFGPRLFQALASSHHELPTKSLLHQAPRKTAKHLNQSLKRTPPTQIPHHLCPTHRSTPIQNRLQKRLPN
ncbi:hypothetical protein HYFRA_00006322 [Hymenoscyphus fraxineus]|uniref:Uncharacterized protein n=1 Tax=Hymenoscyphus fraxineus TaxID=746836 RepID=A0A9N9L9X9_9HELO|nr:hypothetical protein HYFRA_00006322 [Hymenoscyphus fraxineus]